MKTEWVIINISVHKSYASIKTCSSFDDLGVVPLLNIHEIHENRKLACLIWYSMTSFHGCMIIVQWKSPDVGVQLVQVCQSEAAHVYYIVVSDRTCH